MMIKALVSQLVEASAKAMGDDFEYWKSKAALIEQELYAVIHSEKVEEYKKGWEHGVNCYAQILDGNSAQEAEAKAAVSEMLNEN